MKKRDRMQIIFDMLKAIIDKGGQIKPTHLLYKGNLSHTMMQEYVAELKKSGFMSELEDKKGKRYIITDSGREYILKYQQIKEFTEGFGL
jgi:predicted transcriptional regulator